MSVKVKYKNGLDGVVSDKVADILEKRGEVEIIDVADKQPDLIPADDAKPKKARR